MPDEPEEFKHK